jgi:hypothetical protein
MEMETQHFPCRRKSIFKYLLVEICISVGYMLCSCTGSKRKLNFLLLPVMSTPNQQKTKCMTNFLKKSEFKEKYYTTLK